MTYLEYISKIKELSEFESIVRGRRVYKIEDKYVSLWVDELGNELNGLQYLSDDDGFFWKWSKPEEFCERYLNESNKLKFHLYSFRKYGQPKLSKPIELKGIKQSFSVDYIPRKCKCQIFVNGNDVWIKHGDYFSPSMNTLPEESGAPLDYLANKYAGKNKGKKFIYGDAWGSIVLRQEAWIQLKSLVYWIERDMFDLDILSNLLREQEKLHGWQEYELSPSNMERFIESVILQTKKHLKEGVTCEII